MLTDSSNSSVPPSQDTLRPKESNEAKETKKAPVAEEKRRRGGQPGHEGHHREHLPADRVEKLSVDRSKIPADRELKQLEPEVRQVVNIKVVREVVEYQAEVLEDQYGNRYTAEFPPEVRSYFQYGDSVKEYVVNMSSQQLIPFERLAIHMKEVFGIPISQGTIRNYIRDAAQRLNVFMIWLKAIILMLKILYVDETGFNIGKKTMWVHIHCNNDYTLLYPHEKRGGEAIEDIAIISNLPEDAIIEHDCWSPYFQYDCQHALCWAHLKRELQGVKDKEQMKWPEQMMKLMVECLKLEEDSIEKENRGLNQDEYMAIRKKWRTIVTKGTKETLKKIEDNMLPNDKASLSENLLNRLDKYENEYLRHLLVKDLDATNNVSERGLRFLKLRNKISGYTNSIETAKEICTIRSYIDTCMKHDMTAELALNLLYKNKLPDFVDLSIVDQNLFKEK